MLHFFVNIFGAVLKTILLFCVVTVKFEGRAGKIVFLTFLQVHMSFFSGFELQYGYLLHGQSIKIGSNK